MLVDSRQKTEPLDLKSVLWNWRTSPYSTHEARWLWVERATSAFRKRREAFSVSSDRVICRVLGRYWLTFSGDGGLIPTRLMTEGSWELFLTEALAHECKPGMVVVDVGANIGYYSVLMADQVGSTGRVYACEPVPALQKVVHRNFEINWFDDARMKIITAPLFGVAGKRVEFLIPTDNKNARIASTGEKDGDVLSLTTTTFDDMVESEPKVDVVKIDAEGAEMAIWQGMQRTIARSPDIRIFLEFNTTRSYSPVEFLDIIEKDGFPLRVLDELKGVVSITRHALLTERLGEDRILYLHRE